MWEDDVCNVCECCCEARKEGSCKVEQREGWKREANTQTTGRYFTSFGEVVGSVKREGKDALATRMRSVGVAGVPSRQNASVVCCENACAARGSNGGATVRSDR